MYMSFVTLQVCVYVCMYVFSVVMYNYEAEMVVSESEYIPGADLCVYALCDFASLCVCVYVCV